MQKVHIYVESDTTAPRQMPRIIGRLMISESFPEEKDWREKTIWNYGSYHAVILRGIAEAVDQLKQPCEIYIHTQNNWVLNQIEKNLPVWAAHSFRSKTGAEIKNVFEWRWLWKSLAKYGHTITAVHGMYERYPFVMKKIEKVKKAAGTDKH